MADYGDPINTYDYKYRKPVYYTNPFSVYQTNLVVKMVLTEDNFNFDLPKSDGSDFRLLSSSGGVLKMWIAYWSVSVQHAILFFKVPSIGGGSSVTFSAYWGNESATDPSDPDSMGFLFYESFSDTSLDASKWTGYLLGGGYPYGHRLSSESNDFITITDPLLNKYSWTMEAGLHTDFNDNYLAYTTPSVYFGFEGTENDFRIGISQTDRIRHNATEPEGGTYEYVIKTYGGLEGPNSYQDIYIDYYEPNDMITVSLSNRNTYDDVEYEIYRKVEGDTRPTNVSVCGYATGGARYYTYISWFVVREYDGILHSSFDCRDLYIQHENIPHQGQDYREYLPDLTSIVYPHESSFGGNPYSLSDEGFDLASNVWISADDATVEPKVDLTIHTGHGSDVTDNHYRHYDSGHVYYYNASKLSDNDTDKMDRNFFHCTTSSGWVSIRFPYKTNIGAFRVRSTSNLDALPKDFEFYGTNYNPTYYFDSAKKVIDGTFEETDVWQQRVIDYDVIYKYYILSVDNTFDNKDIEIQEWELLQGLGITKKRYVSQLRLHPATYDDWQYNFPSEITLSGTNDGVNWTELLPWTRTYTPFVEHYTGYGYWQRYSMSGVNGFWSYRLSCRGNWAADDNKIIIGEWSMHELASEEYTYRILSGISNNIQQIWATENCGIDDNTGIIFIANEKMNRVSKYKLVESEDLSEGYEDFNVV